MLICANCEGEALYTYVISPNYGINYCQYHLPRFLTAQREAGLLPLIDFNAPKPTKKKIVDPVPVDETPTA